MLADEFVVLTVRSDPEPMDPLFRGRAQRTVVQANSHAPQLSAAELLELQRRVAWVSLQELIVLVSERLCVSGKRIKGLPEALRGRVFQSSRTGPDW